MRGEGREVEGEGDGEWSKIKRREGKTVGVSKVNEPAVQSAEETRGRGRETDR